MTAILVIAWFLAGFVGATISLAVDKASGCPDTYSVDDIRNHIWSCCYGPILLIVEIACVFEKALSPPAVKPEQGGKS